MNLLPRTVWKKTNFKAATSTFWNNEVITNAVQVNESRMYELYYTFGAAPRDLSDISAFASPEGQTRTTPSLSARVEPSHFITLQKMASSCPTN